MAAEFRRRACTSGDRISKITTIAFAPTDTAAYLASIDIDTWEVTSFNAQTREVCITVTTPGGFRDFTVTLVQPIFKATD